MTTLKETVNKITKLYSDLNDCNDGFAGSMTINDIELALKEYGRECSKASLEKASERGLVKHSFPGNSETSKAIGDGNQVFTVDKESITDESNIVLL